MAAAILLSAAGCAQDSKRPEPSKPAASAVSETSAENVEAAEEAPQKPQPSRRFDDSRITTLYDVEFSYTDPNGNKDTYFYEVPQIDDDTEGARNINEMIGYLLTVADIGGQNVREFAKDWYRSYDLGYGEGKSGILFLIALDSRDYVTITYGGGVTAFTDYRIAQIEDKIVPMLSDGSYYKASDTCIEICDDTLDFYADKGAPLDSGNDPAKGWIKWVFVLVIPLAVASIVCGIFYAQMKTANEQTHANAYLPAEGLALSVVEDTYTHTTETETYDPVKDDSSSGSSGSSTDSDGFGGSSGGKF